VSWLLQAVTWVALAVGVAVVAVYLLSRRD
jgi:hypothetical protein